MAAPVLTQNIAQYPVGSGPVEMVDPRGTAFGSSVTSSGGGLPAGDREVLRSDGNAPVAKDRAVSEVGQSDDALSEGDEIGFLEEEISALEREIMQQAGQLYPIPAGNIRQYEDCIRILQGEIDNVHQIRGDLIDHFSDNLSGPVYELIQVCEGVKGGYFDQVHLCHLDQQAPVPLENVFYESGFGVGLSSTPTPFNWNDVPFPVLNDIFNSLDVSEDHRDADFARDAMNMPPSQQPVLQESVGQKYAPPIPEPQMGMAQHHAAVPVQGGPVPAPPVDVAPMNGAVNPGMAPPTVSLNNDEVHSFSEPPNVAKGSPKPDDNHLSDRISKNTIIWKLFEKLFHACPAWLSRKDKPEAEAGLKKQVIESLKKEESPSSTAGGNELDILKERKERLENIRSYLKELSEAKEWMNKMGLFVNSKEVLKGLMEEVKSGGHSRSHSHMAENSQRPHLSANLV